MNNSTLFIQAHAMTKKIIQAGDNYRVTFGACIKFIKAKVKNVITKVKVTAPSDFIMNTLLEVLEDYQDEMTGNDASDVLLPMSQFKEMLPELLQNKNTYRSIVIPVLKELKEQGIIALNMVKDCKGFFILKPVTL